MTDIHPDRRRPRRRRALAAVLVFDVVALAVLGYVLLRPSSHHDRARVASVPAHRLVSDSGLPATTTQRSSSTTTVTHTSASQATTARVAPTGAVLGPGAQRSFARLAAHLGLSGRLSLAVQPVGGGPAQTLGADPPMVAMSTSKVLILSALLAARHGRLTARENRLAHAAITASDNDSILALFGDLERLKGGLTGASAYATSLLRSAGDTRTAVSTAPPPPGYVTTFGQTRWSPSRQVTFMRLLAAGCVIPAGSRDYVLRLMGEIIPSERWGLGSAAFPQVAFKGGWGPLGGGYGVRQMGIVGSGSSRVAVAITIDPAPSFGAGQSEMTAVAKWLQGQLQLSPRTPVSCQR